MQEDSIQTNKLEILGKLTASLIHEIRNSLSVIKFNLEYLEMLKAELPENANESVVDSAAATSRIQYLVDNLLSFSRKSPGNFEYVSVNRIAEDVGNIIQVSASKKNVKVYFDFDYSIPRLYVDSNKIFQVFINLVTNAVESIEGTGEVSLKSYFRKELLDDIYIWEITDTGKGIPDDVKEKIFNDFFTNKKNGTGLGLGVCKRLLEDNNAEVNFESEAGKGTSFFIKFYPDQNQANI
ncbi:MAG: hypothetical protein SCALA702_26580 [Melioribacteraceae bacterium]|nr:MAG: hypothetical protein SCALA702_26580 [Melioribacteraceae bacterium]